ncbi:MAG: aldehyde dehydrogenase family protein, partial [Chitinophagales bacterium]
MTLFQKHQTALNKAVAATQSREFYYHHPEHHNAYPKEKAKEGYEAFEAKRDKPFGELLQTGGTDWVGNEESPFWQKTLGITYPQTPIEVLINNAQTAFKTWRKTSIEERAGILMESIERISQRYFEIAYSTQHTAGQSFGMSFQASGPHATDRAVEAIAMAYQELTRFPHETKWEKPMGRTKISLQKTFLPIPKGIGLSIGCSTFPVWNSVSGLYANLMAGNVAILKPHPTGILPIAIYIAELQKVLQENGFSSNTIQLAVDSPSNLITKELAEHPAVRLIDFTGSSEFGSYIESLQSTSKEVFTEKAGVNSIIIDSAPNLRQVMRNLAFSLSLYSGQMCTAPQNIFIPKTGVQEGDELVSYERVVDLLQNEVAAHVLSPRMKVTLGA